MNDDTISRQAAIDIANDIRACISVDGYWAWMERPKRLPSAQPDNDMIHLQKEQAYLKGWKDGREALRKEMWEYGRDRLD